MLSPVFERFASRTSLFGASLFESPIRYYNAELAIRASAVFMLNASNLFQIYLSMLSLVVLD